MLSKQLAAVLILASAVAARPIPQGAGVGAGCDSIFSDTDTTIGDLTQSEGQSLGNKLGAGTLRKRQGAGVGAGCDSIFSDSDTTVGDFTQSEGEQIGKDLSGSSTSTGSAGTGNAPAPAPGPGGPKGPKGPKKRQANGIGYGIADIVDALPGGSAVGNPEGSLVNTIDGDGTQGSANLGAAIGNGELALGKEVEAATGAQDSYSHGGAHSSNVKRQGNGIGYGIEDVLQEVPGAQGVAGTEGSEVNDIDGNTTNGSADVGASIGEFEESMGKSLETMTGAQDSYSNGGAHSSS